MLLKKIALSHLQLLKATCKSDLNNIKHSVRNTNYKIYNHNCHKTRFKRDIQEKLQ